MNAMHMIQRWNPDDAGFWEREGRRVAVRNLAVSIAALVLSFAVWMLWSVIVVHLPAAGFRFSTNQLFWLAALPALSGATLRVFYAFAVPVFGGRRWTALSTASLLLPTVGIGMALGDPTTPYDTMVVLALLCGLGGGNFASSMAHISHFFPRHRVGWAMGLNAGLGNLGVSLAQAAVPVVVLFAAPAPTGAPALEWVGWIWAPFIVAASLAAWVGMNDLAEVKSGFAEQAIIFRRLDNWLLCWLYVATFGSFIGYAAGFPLLLANQFPQDPLSSMVWVGPLVGAVLRPLGGAWSDRYGGSRVTLCCLAAMLAAVVAIWPMLPDASHPGHLWALVACFMVLFAAAGIGSSSVFKMVPSAFVLLHEQAARRGGAAKAAAERQAHIEAAASLGFCSAIGAYGGFVIPKALGSSLAWLGTLGPALTLFAAFYLSCIAITWWRYGRAGAALRC